MRIGILGTRGIPNQYGGFEQFAEYAAPLLVERGHEVFVYNSSSHPFNLKEWKGVTLIRKKDPENRLGTFGQFIYDFNCILDARNRKFDVILQLGYTSSSIWSLFFPKDPLLITNMDGLEWKRTKYSKSVRWFLKQAEKWAVKYSDRLIADSTIIQSYLQVNHGQRATYIPYGATQFNEPDELFLLKYRLKKFQYNMMVARIEPENNIEPIIKGHVESRTTQSLLIIGNCKNKYAAALQKKYMDPRIIFYGPLFDIDELNQLRYFSSFYFHGHSVGGTNPSLLEAMASQALIVAHKNGFNQDVLGEDAFYFSNSKDIMHLLNTDVKKHDHADKVAANFAKIESDFSWEHIVDLLEECIYSTLFSFLPNKGTTASAVKTDARNP